MSRLASNWITASTYIWIDIRSYKDSNGDGIGDVSGLVSNLDYLKDIGIGAIMFPAMQPTDFAYGGTMTTKFCNVDPCLGTLEDFDELVNEAHKRNIAVAFGWYPYSTHPDHSYFQASRNPRHPEHKIYADYYRWANDPNMPLPRRGLSGHWEWDEQRKQYYHTIWKTVDGSRWCPETSPYSQKMREENERVIRFWLERGLDGFWIDCGTAGGFYKNDDHVRFSREMNAIIHSYPNKLSIAEGGGSVETTIHQDGFDQFWGHLPLYETVFKPDPSLGTFVLGHKGHECCGVNEMLLGTFVLPKGNQHCQVYPSVTPVKNRYRLVKPDEWKNPIAVARVKQFLALALTLPVVPMFIMGTECGLSLLQADVVGPKWDYSPMLWDRSPNYGFTTGKPFVPVNPDGYPIGSTVKEQLADPDSILNCFKKIANLRRSNPELQANEMILETYAKVPTQDDQKYFAFLRYSAKSEQRFLVVANLQDSAQEVICDFGKTQHKISASYEMIDLYSGMKERKLNSNKYTVSLPACGFKILQTQRK